MAKVSASPSITLPVNTMAAEASSFRVTLWLLATGASFNGVTVRFTVAGTLSTVPSLTRKVKLSVPWKLGVGRIGEAPGGGMEAADHAMGRTGHDGKGERIPANIAAG